MSGPLSLPCVPSVSLNAEVQPSGMPDSEDTLGVIQSGSSPHKVIERGRVARIKSEDLIIQSLP